MKTQKPAQKKLTLEDLASVAGGRMPVIEKHEIPSTGDLPCKFEM